MSKELLEKCYKELSELNGLVVKSEKVDCDFDELLSEISQELLKQNMTIEDYYNEWEKAIDELDSKAKKLFDLKETYAQLEQKIIAETDFKDIYGKNNESIRKTHVKAELSDMVTERQDLELRIDYLKRRVDYIKSVMNMQRTFIEVGVM